VELRSAAAGDELMIVGSVGKDLDYFNVGESALPLRVIEDVELTPFHSPSQSKDYLETTRLHEAMFVSRQDVELKRQAGYTRITDPFFCLRETIADLWKNVYKRPEVHHQFITRCSLFRSLYAIEFAVRLVCPSSRQNPVVGRPFLFDGDPGPLLLLLQSGTVPQFRPISVVAKWLDGSRYHLVGR